MTDKKNVKIKPASKELQMRAGTGTVPAEKIAQLQKVMDEAPVDFPAMAQEFLDELQSVLSEAASEVSEDHVRKIVKLVMDVKANARMFGYPVVTIVAETMLNFLEGLKKVDQEALGLIHLFHSAITALITADIRESSDLQGQKLHDELVAACTRYQSKYPQHLKG